MTFGKARLRRRGWPPVIIFPIWPLNFYESPGIWNLTACVQETPKSVLITGDAPCLRQGPPPAGRVQCNNFPNMTIDPLTFMCSSQGLLFSSLESQGLLVSSACSSGLVSWQHTVVLPTAWLSYKRNCQCLINFKFIYNLRVHVLEYKSVFIVHIHVYKLSGHYFIL